MSIKEYRKKILKTLTVSFLAKLIQTGDEKNGERRWHDRLRLPQFTISWLWVRWYGLLIFDPPDLTDLTHKRKDKQVM